MYYKIIYLFTILSMLCVYSLFIYTISFIPFSGLNLSSFHDTFVFVVAIFFLNKTFLHCFYFLYSKINFLQNIFSKLIIGFSLSSSILLFIDFILKGLSINIILIFLLSLLLAFTYLEDPNASRSFNSFLKGKRNIKDNSENK